MLNGGGGGGRTSVSNIDMMKWHSSVECRLLSVSRYAISDIPDSQWQDLVWEQSLQHLIASILDEIVNVTADLIEEHEAERKAFEFTSDCLRIVWLQLFDASINLGNKTNETCPPNMLKFQWLFLVAYCILLDFIVDVP